MTSIIAPNTPSSRLSILSVLLYSNKRNKLKQIWIITHLSSISKTPCNLKFFLLPSIDIYIVRLPFVFHETGNWQIRSATKITQQQNYKGEAEDKGHFRPTIASKFIESTLLHTLQSIASYLQPLRNRRE